MSFHGGFGSGSSGGGITTPPSRAHVQSGTITTTAQAYTKIAVDTIDFDPGGYMSTVQGRYNCPATGYYYAMGEIHTNANPGDSLLVLYKNGVNVSWGTRNGGGQTNIGHVVCDILKCNAGDYIELWLYTFNVTTLQVSTPENYLSVTPLQ